MQPSCRKLQGSKKSQSSQKTVSRTPEQFPHTPIQFTHTAFLDLCARRDRGGKLSLEEKMALKEYIPLQTRLVDDNGHFKIFSSDILDFIVSNRCIETSPCCHYALFKLKAFGYARGCLTGHTIAALYRDSGKDLDKAKHCKKHSRRLIPDKVEIIVSQIEEQIWKVAMNGDEWEA